MRTTIAVVVALALLLIGGWAANAAQSTTSRPVGSELEVPTTGSLSVRVVLQNGSPAAGAVVTVRPDPPTPGGYAYPSGTTDRQGRVRIDGIAPGQVRAIARLTGQQSADLMGQVAAGGVLSGELRVVPSDSVEAKLSRSVVVGLWETPVNEVLDYVRRKLLIGVCVDPAIAERMQASKVSLPPQSGTFKDQLDRLCAAVGNITYVIDEKAGVVTIRALK